jgi:MHS family proline/betaine transporter-like MFS transporter
VAAVLASHRPEPSFLLLGQFGFVLMVAGFYGCLPAFMVEVVPREVRCTATALGYNVALGVIGGLSPLAATWLVERTDDDYIPAFMIMASAAMSFIALLSLRTTVLARPGEMVVKPAVGD